MNPKVMVSDGKTYHSVEDIPADVREKYKQAMRPRGEGNIQHFKSDAGVWYFFLR